MPKHISPIQGPLEPSSNRRITKLRDRPNDPLVTQEFYCVTPEHRAKNSSDCFVTILSASLQRFNSGIPVSPNRFELREQAWRTQLFISHWRNFVSDSSAKHRTRYYMAFPVTTNSFLRLIMQLGHHTSGGWRTMRILL